MHAIAYVFNWASVWVNPLIYILAQKKYQVKNINVKIQWQVPLMTIIFKQMIQIQT